MPHSPPGERGSVIVTGASSGLGAALALAYARRGKRLGLVARRRQRLEAVAQKCRDAGGSVEVGNLDVANRPSFAEWLAAFDDASPVSLAIANAGAFAGIGRDGAFEDDEELASLVASNFVGAINTATVVASRMQRRRQGRIVLVSSLAAWHPLADAPVYSATKAGLLAYGEALRERLAPDGIAVTFVLPGHINTAQTDAHLGPLPFIMSADRAAEVIVRGLDRQREVIAFPRRLVAMIGLGRSLPWRVRARAGRRLRFTVDAAS